MTDWSQYERGAGKATAEATDWEQYARPPSALERYSKEVLAKQKGTVAPSSIFSPLLTGVRDIFAPSPGEVMQYGEDPSETFGPDKAIRGIAGRESAFGSTGMPVEMTPESRGSVAEQRVEPFTPFGALERPTQYVDPKDRAIVQLFAEQYGPEFAAEELRRKGYDAENTGRGIAVGGGEGKPYELFNPGGWQGVREAAQDVVGMGEGLYKTGAEVGGAVGGYLAGGANPVTGTAGAAAGAGAGNLAANAQLAALAGLFLEQDVPVGQAAEQAVQEAGMVGLAEGIGGPVGAAAGWGLRGVGRGLRGPVRRLGLHGPKVPQARPRVPPVVAEPPRAPYMAPEVRVGREAYESPEIATRGTRPYESPEIATDALPEFRPEARPLGAPPEPRGAYESPEIATEALPQLRAETRPVAPRSPYEAPEIASEFLQPTRITGMKGEFEPTSNQLEKIARGEFQETGRTRRGWTGSEGGEADIERAYGEAARLRGEIGELSQKKPRYPEPSRRAEWMREYGEEPPIGERLEPFTADLERMSPEARASIQRYGPAKVTAEGKVEGGVPAGGMAVSQWEPSMPPPGRGELVEVPTAEIKVDPKTYQFKAKVDPKTGVSKPLKGPYDPEGSAPILLHRRKNGDVYVAHGHHRLELASREGVEGINATVLDEAQGVSPQDAMRLGAEQNIRDGHGDIEDFAKYFRNSDYDLKRVQDRGLVGRGNVKAERGFQLGKNASDSTWSAWLDGRIDDDVAAGIARAAPGDDGRQAAAVGTILKSDKTWKGPDAEAFTRALGATRKARPAGETRQTDIGDILGGFDKRALEEAEALADVVKRRQGELTRRIRAGKGAATRPEEAAELGVEVGDVGVTKGKIKELEAERRGLDPSRWQTDLKKINELRQEAGLEPLTTEEIMGPSPEPEARPQIKPPKGGAEPIMTGQPEPEGMRKPLIEGEPAGPRKPPQRPATAPEPEPEHWTEGHRRSRAGGRHMREEALKSPPPGAELEEIPTWEGMQEVLRGTAKSGKPFKITWPKHSGETAGGGGGELRTAYGRIDPPKDHPFKLERGARDAKHQAHEMRVFWETDAQGNYLTEGEGYKVRSFNAGAGVEVETPDGRRLLFNNKAAKAEPELDDFLAGEKAGLEAPDYELRRAGEFEPEGSFAPPPERGEFGGVSRRPRGEPKEFDLPELDVEAVDPNVLRRDVGEPPKPPRRPPAEYQMPDYDPETRARREYDIDPAVRGRAKPSRTPEDYLYGEDVLDIPDIYYGRKRSVAGRTTEATGKGLEALGNFLQLPSRAIDTTIDAVLGKTEAPRWLRAGAKLGAKGFGGIGGTAAHPLVGGTVVATQLAGVGVEQLGKFLQRIATNPRAADRLRRAASISLRKFKGSEQAMRGALYLMMRSPEWAEYQEQE